MGRQKWEGDYSTAPPPMDLLLPSEVNFMAPVPYNILFYGRLVVIGRLTSTVGRVPFTDLRSEERLPPLHPSHSFGPGPVSVLSNKPKGVC